MNIVTVFILPLAPRAEMKETRVYLSQSNRLD